MIAWSVLPRSTATSFFDNNEETRDGSSNNDSFQIFIVTTDGKTVTLKVKTSDTIEDVKIQLCYKVGMPPNFQQMILEGKQLLNHHTLADLNVQRNTTIRMVSGILGGMQQSAGTGKSPIFPVFCAGCKKPERLIG